MILADKLIQLRKKSGMSQEELAEKMNVSRQAVSKWEGAQSIPDLEKILQLAELYGVTTDYLLKDSLEAEEFAGKDTPIVRRVTLEEANEFMQLRKAAAPRIAFATFLCIISVIPLFLLGGASEVPEFHVSSNFAGGVGMIIMLVVAAIAVGIFVTTGFRSEKYEFLEKEPFEVEYGVSGAVNERKKSFRDTYVKCNIIGTVLCVLSPAALFAAAIRDENFFSVIMLCVMFLTVGIGVMFFVYAGVRNASMEKLLKSGEFSEKKKKISRVKSIVSPIYWSIVVAAYLLWLFLDKEKNSLSWVIFPVAGVLFPAVLGICGLIERDPNDKQ